ncbi:hypothetical protein [Geodermatophilus sp. URMC 62]|uniref:hypothetical protein n=1 Tax=Geodermatophilus sp. URMC 62 TaxID=3423414 RepID=UPI00406D2210
MTSIQSGDGFQPERLRNTNDEIIFVRDSRRDATPPTPAPSSVDLLADLIEKLAAAERANAERHAEVIARLTAIDTAVFRAEDAANCASSEATDQGRLTREVIAELRLDVWYLHPDDEPDEDDSPDLHLV